MKPTIDLNQKQHLELELAKALNGPWNLNGVFDEPFDKPTRQRYTLQEVRDVKWGQLTSQEQNVRIQEVRSLIKHLFKHPSLMVYLPLAVKDIPEAKHKLEDEIVMAAEKIKYAAFDDAKRKWANTPVSEKKRPWPRCHNLTCNRTLVCVGLKNGKPCEGFDW